MGLVEVLHLPFVAKTRRQRERGGGIEPRHSEAHPRKKGQCQWRRARACRAVAAQKGLADQSWPVAHSMRRKIRRALFVFQPQSTTFFPHGHIKCPKWPICKYRVMHTAVSPLPWLIQSSRICHSLVASVPGLACARAEEACFFVSRFSYRAFASSCAHWAQRPPPRTLWQTALSSASNPACGALRCTVVLFSCRMRAQKQSYVLGGWRLAGHGEPCARGLCGFNWRL